MREKPHSEGLTEQRGNGGNIFLRAGEVFTDEAEVIVTSKGIQEEMVPGKPILYHSLTTCSQFSVISWPAAMLLGGNVLL